MPKIWQSAKKILSKIILNWHTNRICNKIPTSFNHFGCLEKCRNGSNPVLLCIEPRHITADC